MTFLSAQAAIIAAAIAIPALLILYFLKLRRREVEVSTTLLWKRAIQDLQANAPFQRLRRNILLFLQLIALAAALFALAQPQIQAEMPVGGKHIILLDRSASMAALDETGPRGGAVSRMDKARERALAVVDSLRTPGIFSSGGGDEAMVIAFDTTAEVRQTFTADKGVLRAAIGGVGPSGAGTLGSEAFGLARAHVPKRILEGQVVEGLLAGTPGTLHLMSDGRLGDAQKLTPAADEQFIYHAVGRPDAVNIGITSLRASRAYDNPARLTVFVGIESTDPLARTVDVELLIDGIVAAIKPVELPAMESAPGGGGRAAPAASGVSFVLERAQGGIAAVRLTPPTGGRVGDDVLRQDDTGWLVIPPAKRLSVALVTRGNLFLASALEGLALAQLAVLTPQQYEALGPGAAAQFDVVVLDRWLPAEPAGADVTMPPGRYLVLGAMPPPPFGALDEGEAGGAVVIDWARDHPTLRGLSLDNVRIGTARSYRVERGSAATVLATADTGPVILELSRATTRAIAVGFDVAESNWPFEVSFVVFLASSISYLGDDGADADQSVGVGEFVRDRLPPGAADARMSGPEGADAQIVPGADGWFDYGPVPRAGIYTLTWRGERGSRDGEIGGRSARLYAANLLDSLESDARAALELLTGSRNVAAFEMQRSAGTRRLWPWLLAGALGVIMLEWWVYNRKVQL